MITEEMRIKVMEKLHEIERSEHVKVLYAVETASRAWGFPSENSDWDIRFIYVHDLPWYVSIAQNRDVIEYMSDDRMVDMVGWDLKKALTLMRRDASSINEWLHTPLTYYCDEAFLKRLLQIEDACFSAKQGVNHYFGFARHMATEKITSQLTTMKYFLYFVRVLLACRWIEEKKTPPPVPFMELIQATVADESIKTKLVQWYFSIAKTEDSVKLMLDDEDIDMEGYDLKKALTLLSRTNPNESDWLHAKDYLIVDDDFLHAMQAFEAQCYNLHHAMYHFYSIALNHYQRYLEKEVTIKRFVYYMRALLSCRWVEQRGSHPPVIVDELIDATVTDNETVREKAHRLLALKRTGRSHDKAIVDAQLAEYMFDLQSYYEQLLPKYKDIKPQADFAAMSRYLMNVAMREMET